MKNKKFTLSVLLLSFGLSLQAQEVTTATGGNATGSTGNVSYTVGQIGYTVNSGSSGTVTEGVQQPYELFVVAGTGNPNVTAEMAVYPNPTTGMIILSIKNQPLAGFSFQLFDGMGRIVEQRKITSVTEIIRMQSLPASAYFLKVTQLDQIIKTFKIIKN